MHPPLRLLSATGPIFQDTGAPDLDTFTCAVFEWQNVAGHHALKRAPLSRDGARYTDERIRTPALDSMESNNAEHA